jgi:methionine-rich copper-binding protein CopC
MLFFALIITAAILILHTRARGKEIVKLKYGLKVVSIGLILLLSRLSFAQPSSSAVYRQAADITGLVAKTESSPLNDAVLNSAPNQLSLVFPQRVRLVKLTLRNELRDWVDISFRYDPKLDNSFVWELPNLRIASYYTADWAILAANEQLVRGTFSFSFGPGAEPPSLAKEAEALLLEMRAGDPNTRFVQPPRTEIIIDRDPPSYDPPFTIQLEPSANPDHR